MCSSSQQQQQSAHIHFVIQCERRANRKCLKLCQRPLPVRIPILATSFVAFSLRRKLHSIVFVQIKTTNKNWLLILFKISPLVCVCVLSRRRVFTFFVKKMIFFLRLSRMFVLFRVTQRRILVKWRLYPRQNSEPLLLLAHFFSALRLTSVWKRMKNLQII